MNSLIFNPLEEYDGKLKSLHLDKTQSYFEKLTTQSGVSIQENRITVKDYEACKESVSKLRKKLNLWRFWRVLMCITLILIPLVIIKITPKIRALREEIENVNKKAEELPSIERERENP